MTFSFTADAVGDVSIQKHNEGVVVKGIFEKFQENPYSEYAKMKDAGVDVSLDSNPKNMHHKVFIIDNETVIFGSYNPSKNGNENNDENILIVHDEELAKQFLEEFWRIA